MLLLSVEEALRTAGKTAEADALDKLQCDVTAWQAFADTPTPKKGEKTSQFVARYTPITPSRVNAVLDSTTAALPAGELKTSFASLAQDLRFKGSSPVQHLGARR